MAEVRHGWYNSSYGAEFGTSFYRGEDGKTVVEVSNVTQSRSKPDWMTGDCDHWYMGPVTNWIRKGVEGSSKLQHKSTPYSRR